MYLAHDTVLDRDVAFALIKTEGLDDVAKTRITREAQAMGRLGDHPHLMPIFDLGNENGQPYMTLSLMGGDVEGLAKKAPTANSRWTGPSTLPRPWPRAWPSPMARTSSTGTSSRGMSG